MRVRARIRARIRAQGGASTDLPDSSVEGLLAGEVVEFFERAVLHGEDLQKGDGVARLDGIPPTLVFDPFL